MLPTLNILSSIQPLFIPEYLKIFYDLYHYLYYMLYSKVCGLYSKCPVFSLYIYIYINKFVDPLTSLFFWNIVYYVLCAAVIIIYKLYETYLSLISITLRTIGHARVSYIYAFGIQIRVCVLYNMKTHIH